MDHRVLSNTTYPLKNQSFCLLGCNISTGPNCGGSGTIQYGVCLAFCGPCMLPGGLAHGVSWVSLFALPGVLCLVLGGCWLPRMTAHYQQNNHFLKRWCQSLQCTVFGRFLHMSGNLCAPKSLKGTSAILTTGPTGMLPPPCSQVGKKIYCMAR